MAETHRTRSGLLTEVPVGVEEGTSAQDIRDIIHSAMLTRVRTLDSETPALDDDDVVVLLDGSSNTVAAALPAASGAEHRMLFIKAVNIDSAVTLTGDVEGGSPYTFATAGDAVTLACDGTLWHILSEYLNA